MDVEDQPPAKRRLLSAVVKVDNLFVCLIFGFFFIFFVIYFSIIQSGLQIQNKTPMEPYNYGENFMFLT